MSVRIVATIEARMRSTRLPGKVLKPILGRPMLALMVERLQRVRQLDEIVVATSDDSSCDPIEELARQLKVGYFRGSEEDVLDRVLQAGQQAGADVIVETTGDCPLIDPGTTDRAIQIFLESDVDYCSNHLDVQVFPLSVLEKVPHLTDDRIDHEHVTLYIYEHPAQFRVLDVSHTLPVDSSDLRLCVDTPEDFALVTRIYEALYPTNSAFTLKDILDLFAKQPELRAINRHIRGKPVR